MVSKKRFNQGLHIINQCMHTHMIPSTASSSNCSGIVVLHDDDDDTTVC